MNHRFDNTEVNVVKGTYPRILEPFYSINVFELTRTFFRFTIHAAEALGSADTDLLINYQDTKKK